MGLSRTNVQKILKKNFGTKSYSTKVTQQLSATDHTKRLQFCQIKDEFPWIARSPDLSVSTGLLPLRARETKSIKSKPSNIQDLKQKVVEVVTSISPNVLQRVIKNFEDRLSICIAAAGDTLEK